MRVRGPKGRAVRARLLGGTLCIFGVVIGRDLLRQANGWRFTGLLFQWLAKDGISFKVRRLWFRRPSGRRQLPNSPRIRVTFDGLKFHIHRGFFPIPTSFWFCLSPTDTTPTSDNFLRSDCYQWMPPVARLCYRGRTVCRCS